MGKEKIIMEDIYLSEEENETEQQETEEEKQLRLMNINRNETIRLWWSIFAGSNAIGFAYLFIRVLIQGAA